MNIKVAAFTVSEKYINTQSISGFCHLILVVFHVPLNDFTLFFLLLRNINSDFNRDSSIKN